MKKDVFQLGLTSRVSQFSWFLRPCRKLVMRTNNVAQNDVLYGQSGADIVLYWTLDPGLMFEHVTWETSKMGQQS